MPNLVNPRQRRKARSGGKLSQSKQSKRNQHKVVVKGPDVLVKNWDKHKTVRQNYAAMGLMPTMNPRQAGGLEPVERVPYAVAHRSAPTMQDMEAFDEAASDDDDDDDDDQEEEDDNARDDTEEATARHDDATTAAEAPAKLQPGMARIIRDDDGKVIKVIMPGEDGHEVEQVVKSREERGEDDEDEDEDDEEEGEEEEERPKVQRVSAIAMRKRKQQDEPQPWGKPMTTWQGEGSDEGEPESEDEDDIVPGKQGIPLTAKRRKVHAKTDVVRELESIASHEHKVARHTSQLEHEWLIDLVAKYGTDTASMARDRKVNVWQKTSGEIKRAIAKAGGFEKLKA
ncbi:Nucleolar protein 16 [Microbotryomycetes sp. JL221]|nr:Nucleolar protein 16 [Microbotryomycetes sp. JL221]